MPSNRVLVNVVLRIQRVFDIDVLDAGVVLIVLDDLLVINMILVQLYRLLLRGFFGCFSFVTKTGGKDDGLVMRTFLKLRLLRWQITSRDKETLWIAASSRGGSLGCRKI
jgi:hypothetical protein